MGSFVIQRSKGGDGVEEKGKTRTCRYGCGKETTKLNNNLYLCYVPLNKCERDGENSLSFTKNGNLMG